MADQNAIAELDTCGLLCPLPVLKARKRLQAMVPGENLRILADDPAARIDFPHFCAEQKHELLSLVDREDGVICIEIRKGAG